MSLLKVVLLGYSSGLMTSRKIERACKENVTFMALCCGERPDHSTVASFGAKRNQRDLPLKTSIIMNPWMSMFVLTERG